MPTKTLADLSKAMQDIDFAMLITKSSTGDLAARPMSNNGDADYDGTSFFFTTDSTAMVAEIGADPAVGLSYAGNKGLLGKPGIFVAVRGKAELIHSRQVFEQHWVKDLERYFSAGLDTPGLVLIQVKAKEVHYWDGEDSGVLTL